ncbi:hypothetical protein Tco_0843468 [Tanacetum coccineum]|uniref:Reverse transcriptase domain-containing protein n=1 Tax=Tanacetum coccineum TaxID=301880 RepID=A0ABQ5B279_9ASTR
MLRGGCLADGQERTQNSLDEDKSVCLGRGGALEKVISISNVEVYELPNILWAHRTMLKTINGETPFSLTYGSEAVIPAEEGDDGDFVYRRNAASRVENQGMLGLNWEGPYRVVESYDNGSHKLATMNDYEEWLDKSIPTNQLVIKEYLVKVNKRRALWSLNEDILKINDSDYQYAVSIKKIRRIRARTHQRPRRKQDQYAVSREDQYAVLEIKHFKTLSLNESISPYDLFSNQEEYSEEEVAELMVETMEQYMSKTRADYGSGVARPKIEEKDSFELKGQFLKELRDNTFSGSDHKDANKHIEKVLEIVDLFHIPNITVDQVMLRAFPMSLTRAAKQVKSASTNKVYSDALTRLIKKVKKLEKTIKTSQARRRSRVILSDDEASLRILIQTGEEMIERN